MEMKVIACTLIGVAAWVGMVWLIKEIITVCKHDDF